MAPVALVSVSDKSNLDRFAAHLVRCGYELLATSGSGSYLGGLGIPVRSIETYTGQREILGGRVKTLHPRIHGGLLAKRDDPAHLDQLRAESIAPIDIAIINLYPFVEQLAGENRRDPVRMIEYIDIGGPTMIRAAAKNFKHVLPLIDPADYERVMPYITAENPSAGVPTDLRRELALKVFTWLANYNLEIARYLSQVACDPDGVPHFAGDRGGELELPPVDGMILEKEQTLRYGENPHQKAALYRPVSGAARDWKQLQGKELSYNNLLDFHAALRLMRALPADRPAAAIIKHLNPCGVAIADSLPAALVKAKRCDPRSHFGGILVFNGEIDKDTAAEIAEDFAEIVVAPAVSPEALAVLQRKKALRVIEAPRESLELFELRSAGSGILMQEPDRGTSRVAEAETVGKRAPGEDERRDLDLAWTICAHVKSNAVVIVRNGMLIGAGAGQMSRIDSTEIALSKAKHHQHTIDGAVAASDAFFPFPDSVELLASHGVRAVIAPRGSKADQQVVEAADSLGIALLFAADRHFRH